ncbi:MAG: ABC transporter substrate-binding protein [Fusobacteriaceae bacterium]
MKKIFLIGCTLMVFLIGYSQKKESVTENKKSKNLTVIQGSKPRSLDPYKYNEFPALLITEHVYNTLVNIDDEGNVVPELAESWEYTTPTEIVFNLRKDVKFHNGNKFDGEDVAFSINRMKEQPGSSAMVENIENVEILAPYKIKVNLKKSSAPFLANFSSALAGIMDKEYSEKNPEKIGTHPMGTGPFIFDKWKDGEKFYLLKNPEYFKMVPKIDSLVFWVITETPNRLIALETGEGDIAQAISPLDVEKIKDKNDIRLETKVTATTDYMALNLNKKSFLDKNFRVAIESAINKKSIVDSLYFGRGQVANSIVNPKIWGSIENELESNYNPELSRELLKNIDTSEINLSIWTSDNPTRLQIAQIVQANLAEVGIKSNIQSVEWGTFLQRTALGEHDILISTWFISAPDADTILRSLVYSGSAGAGGNKSFYKNEEVDKKLALAYENLDKNIRMQKYREIQNILSEDLPIIPLTHRYDTLALRKRVINYKYNKSTLRNLFEVIDIEE